MGVKEKSWWWGGDVEVVVVGWQCMHVVLAVRMMMSVMDKITNDSRILVDRSVKNDPSIEFGILI